MPFDRGLIRPFLVMYKLTALTSFFFKYVYQNPLYTLQESDELVYIQLDITLSCLWATPVIDDFDSDTSANYNVFEMWNDTPWDISCQIDPTFEAYTMVFDGASGNNYHTVDSLMIMNDTVDLDVGESVCMLMNFGSSGTWTTGGMVVYSSTSWYAWPPNGIKLYRNSNIDGGKIHVDKFEGSSPAGELYASSIGYIDSEKHWFGVSRPDANTLEYFLSLDGVNWTLLGTDTDSCYNNTLYVGFTAMRSDTYESWGWAPTPDTVALEYMEIISTLLEPTTAAYINSADYDTFSEAVAAAVGRTLVVAYPVVLDKNTTISGDTHLMFFEGGSIIKASSYTLTVNGPVTAPVMQIFSGFSPGNVTFLAQNIKEVYPQWWGAKADSTTNDSNAIQCAIESGCANIHLLTGNYLLNTPLDITNYGNTKILLTGDGSTEGSDKGTNLIGNTGGVAIDCSGSRHLSLCDFFITSGISNPSTIGILFARTIAWDCVEYNAMINIGIRLSSNTSANAGNGTVGIYNFASEIWRAYNLYLEADTGIVFTGYNVYDVNSPYHTLFTSYPSMSTCTVDGTSTIKSLNGACVIVDNGVSLAFLNTYFCGDDNAQYPCDYAIVVRSTGFWPMGLSVTGHKNRKGGWLMVSDCILQSLRMNVTGQGDGTGVYLEPGYSTITDGAISIAPASADPCEVYLIDAPSTGGGVHNLDIQLYSNQSINVPSRTFSGNTVCTTKTMTEAAASIAVPMGSSYLLLASDGINLVVTPTAVNNNATNIASSSATLNGTIIGTGGANPSVHICWGDNDGGTTTGSWDNDNNLGTKGAGTFYKNISSLTRNTTYYFRCYATNSAGTDWANSTFQFSTAP